MTDVFKERPVQRNPLTAAAAVRAVEALHMHQLSLASLSFASLG